MIDASIMNVTGESTGFLEIGGSNGTVSLSPTVAAFDKAIRWMDYFFVPITFSVGTAGNSISFLVFVSTHIRHLSSSVYLAALAVTDTGFLLCVFGSWANNVGIHWFHQPGWCQTFVYSTYVFSFLSVWYVVAFTVERWIAVRLPFQRKNMCTPRRAKIVVVSLALIASVTYSFAFWTTEVHMDNGTAQCRPRFEYFRLLNYIGSIDTVLTLVIPCVTIVILNVRIVSGVYFINKEIRRMEHETPDSSPNQKSPCHDERIVESMDKFVVASQGSPGSERKSKGKKRTPEHWTPHPSQVRVAKMLVIVSTVFLLLNLPSHLIRVYAFIMHFFMKDFTPSTECLILQRFFTYIYYTNFAINIFLYSACGRNFRYALSHSVEKVDFKFLPCFRCKTPSGRMVPGSTTRGLTYQRTPGLEEGSVEFDACPRPANPPNHDATPRQMESFEI